MKANTIRHYQKRTMSHRIAEVYGAEPTSRPGMGDIAADFAWRRSCGPTKDKAFREELRQLVEETIAREFPAFAGVPIKIRWDRHCGCRMCPCSPGYVVDLVDRSSVSKINIWVD